MRILLTLLLLLLPASVLAQDPAPEASADEETSDDPWREDGWGWAGIPAVSYNTDDGLGGGVLGSVYRYNGTTAPYKSAYTLLLYVTTKSSHTHRIDGDFLDVGGMPLRLSTRVEFSAGKAGNFCGIGPDDVCEYEDNDGDGQPDYVEGIAADQGLEEGSDAYADFVRRYYKIRNVSPNAFINARYKLSELPNKFELMAAWWGRYYISGELGDFEAGPYPGSLYDQYFGTDEEGFMSVLQGGVMLDNRDNEPAPIRGYWLEASVRGATQYWGSRWNYFGFNTTLRGYVPLGTERLVLADRLVFDGVVGDVPTHELSRAGGSQIYAFYGGQRAGRGVRNSGVLGKARALNQLELRWTAFSPEVAGILLDITLLGFLDAGYWAADWSDIPGGNAGLIVGEGGGLRLAFNKNFIIRADVGFSAREGNAMGVYIDINNLF